MSDYFPTEVFNEILLRLPLKTLVRCTCVCKSWNSHITDPTFITTHLNRTTLSSNTNSNNTDLLLLRQQLGKDGRERYSLRLDNRTLDEFAPLEFPFEAHSWNVIFRIVGSCNGLLCLSDDLWTYTDTVILWNPSIRKSVTLPEPLITFDTHGPHSFALGFGFDAKNNDYKVVKLVFPQYNDDDYEAVPVVDLYSLISGAWRRISAAGAPYSVPEGLWSQAFIYGAVHWPAFRGKRSSYKANYNASSSFILSFDLGNEVFRKMELPESLAGNRVVELSIAVFRESLSVFTRGRTGKISMWMMKQYGVAESWSNQFTIDVPRRFVDISSISLFRSISTPVGLTRDGELLWATKDGELVSYHPETQQIMDLAIRGPRDSFYLDT